MGMLTFVIGATHILHDLGHRFPESLIHGLVCHFHSGELAPLTGSFLIGDVFLEMWETRGAGGGENKGAPSIEKPASVGDSVETGSIGSTVRNQL